MKAKRKAPQAYSPESPERGTTSSRIVQPYCTTLSAFCQEGHTRIYVPIRCKTWKCPQCSKWLLKRLRAIAAAGRPTTFLTLTVNTNAYDTPEAAMDALAATWWSFVREIRRRYPEAEMQYLVIVEKTKRGYPHLHVLARMPYVPQQYISEYFATRMDSPVVWIERIKSPQQAIAYVTKYVSKAPARFDGHLRYWRSNNYAPPYERPDPVRQWKPTRGTLPEIAARLRRLGFAVVEFDQALIAYEPIPPPATPQPYRPPIW